MTILETERLILRPWGEADAESLYEYAKDPLVGPAAGWVPHTDIEHSLHIIQDVLSYDESYAVTLKDEGKAIGSIGLTIGGENNISMGVHEANIGFWIGVPYWGQGLIPEATRELMRHAFRDLAITVLWSGYIDGNENSKRVQEKCGFHFHHSKYDRYWPPTQEIKTERITCIRKEEWEKLWHP